MEGNKFRRYYIDWWRIRKSTIYGLAALCIIAFVLGVGGWVAIRYDWFAAANTTEIPKDAARIISFEGDVRITRAATRETILVTKETYVAAGDTVQTQADGRAKIQMIDGSIYSITANSTVVIRDNSSIFGGNNVRVALDDGQLNVRTDQQPENTENVVEMMESETLLKPETDASFNADAYSHGGEIRISRGSVETTIGGERETINANEFAAVQDGKLSAKEGLQLPPKLIAPTNISQVVDSSGNGATVTFTWQDEVPGSAASYYLQVSRSPFFASDSILVDRGSITSREFRLAGLMPGTYYWRLRTTSKTGQTSQWNEPWRFNVVKRESSVALDVAEWGVDRVGGNVYIVSGKTQPGLRVKAQNREVFAGGDGVFRMQISTPLSETALEFSDDRGNRAGFVLSLRTSKVLRKF